MTNAAQSVSGGGDPSVSPTINAFAPVTPPPAPVEAPPPIEIPAAPNDRFGLEPFEAPTEPASSPAPDFDRVTNAEPSGWSEIRQSGEIQFEPIETLPAPPPEPPPEPSWFSQAITNFFSFLGDLLAPVGHLLAASWFWLQWVLLALVVAFVLYLIYRMIGPMGRNTRDKKEAVSEPEWAPSEEQSVALLDDADRLAAEGRYDEATHLLLQRSVSHISAARPDWVEPSSTARELAALPALSLKARSAFGTIAERVERSLFALRSLDRSDWEAARAAYADFANIRIDDREAVEGAGA